MDYLHQKILRLGLLNALDGVFAGQEYTLWGSPSIIPLGWQQGE